ncbi:MAG: hypothetical protein SGI87_12610 [Flavobacteriales bacterium]|nr:hypothetical protein [Flavobacteriales bacterium]
MLEYFARVLFWCLAAIGKFLVTPFFMIFSSEWSASGEHWSWMETILISSSGAALGTFIFFHFGEYIFNWFGHHLGKNKRIFTPGRRRLVRMKWKYGIKGLIMISVFISVPLSSLLAAKFYRHNSSALPLMITGFFFWAIVLTSIAYAGKIVLY